MFFTEDGQLTIQKRVELKPYVGRPPIPREFLTDAEIWASAGQTYAFDVECYPNFFCCNFKLVNTNKFALFECGQNRNFNELKLSWLLNSCPTIGFNSLKYDLLMLWLAYYTKNSQLIKAASNDIILHDFRKHDLQEKYKFIAHKPFAPHTDLIEVAPLKGSLKLYGARLHSPRIQDLPIPDTKELTEEEIEIVTHYNFNDLDVTEQLFHFMKERLELRTAMSAEYNEDLMSKSDAQIAEVVLSKEVAKINGKKVKRVEIVPGTSFSYVPPAYLRYQTRVMQNMLITIKRAIFVVADSGKVKLPDELKSSVRIGNGEYRLGIGGLHSSEENVSYQATEDVSIVDRDVASYYPRLVTTLGLYPLAMGPAFLTAYNRIIDSRLADKAAKRLTASNGKKIVINGAGGKFSDPYSALYGPDLTIQMTVTGQLDLLMFIEALTLCGMQIISANTDGIVTLVKKDKETKFLEVVNWWQTTTGFETEETRYGSYYARDVNSYFAVKLSAKSIKDIKVKGPYSEVGSQSGTQLDTNPTSQICTDAVKQLLLDGTPIEKTIKNCRDFTRFVTVRQAKSPGAHKNGVYLGKTVRWYYAKDELGTINTVSHNSKVADSDGGKPVMDLPSEFPSDINYDWYVAKATEILYEINYLKRQKQLKFF